MTSGRWAWAEIDLDAIAHNIGVVQRAVAPAAVLAVVKADAYGHGAVAVGQTALAAGAVGLGVALVEEGVELRRAEITAPILILSEQPPDQAGEIVANSLTPTVYSMAAIEALAAAADRRRPLGVHIKIDTGMRRVGADPSDVLRLASAIADCGTLRLAGVFTHLAMADEPTAASNASQLSRFDDSLAELRGAGHDVDQAHAANSAAALGLPSSHYDMVRLGIAMYGIEPGPGVSALSALSALSAELRPALSLRARVSLVKPVRAGEGVSYGLRHTFAADTVVATVPIGYADGVPRRLFGTGGEVLIHGARRPIVGVVTMDQLVVECGGLDVAVGDEVVLIGAQSGPSGSNVITAEEWARRLGTIGYEIVCGISKRIARRNH